MSSERGLVSIILATYNERENIVDMVRAIAANVSDPLEVIVVDDNSPDQTAQVALDMHDPRVRVIRRVRARGLASAINRGIIESRGEIVGWMDADLCHPPSLLPRMIEGLNDCDVVIGSRYIGNGADRRSPARVLTSRMVNGLARWILGGGIRDYDSGFILLRREVLDSVSLMPHGYGSYFIELLFACHRKGLKIIEIPYTFTDRAKGTSKSAVNPIQFLVTGLGYVTAILATRFRRLD